MAEPITYGQALQIAKLQARAAIAAALLQTDAVSTTDLQAVGKQSSLLATGILKTIVDSVMKEVVDKTL